MDGVVLRTFDKEFADIEARHFPAFLTARLPSLTGLCVGENFRFGKGRCGDQNFLKKIAPLSGPPEENTNKISLFAYVSSGPPGAVYPAVERCLNSVGLHRSHVFLCGVNLTFLFFQLYFALRPCLA